jgi:uncharacterized protein YqeY
MSLADQITSDMTTAMKSQDAARTAVLRLVKTSLQNERIKFGHDLTDDETLKVIQREAKQRRDSIDAYTKAERGDLAKAEEEELAIIVTYLPEQMSDDELNTLVDQAIAETGATDVAQMGMVMNKVMQVAGGKADGGKVSQLVKAKLLGNDS